MCDPSPLTVGERELIASYVSGLNACTFCHGAHKVAAGIYGVEEGIIDALMTDVDASPVDDKLKPILRYVRKLDAGPHDPGRLRGGVRRGLGGAGAVRCHQRMRAVQFHEQDRGGHRNKA